MLAQHDFQCWQNGFRMLATWFACCQHAITQGIQTILTNRITTRPTRPASINRSDSLCFLMLSHVGQTGSHVGNMVFHVGNMDSVLGKHGSHVANMETMLPTWNPCCQHGNHVGNMETMLPTWFSVLANTIPCGPTQIPCWPTHSKTACGDRPESFNFDWFVSF